MAWQDREYNRDGYGGAGDFLTNPAGILGLSVPFGTWFGVRVRLHFWLLLSFVFLAVDLFQGGSLLIFAINVALVLGVLLCHDFGHRAAAHWVGGELNEFMLWPVGGMIFPTVPPGARATIIGFSGGIFVNLVLGLAAFLGFHILSFHLPSTPGMASDSDGSGMWLPVPFTNPLMSLGGIEMANNAPRGWVLAVCLANFAYLNWGLVVGNLLPYFWFDGGFLWRAVLQPMIGSQAAHNVTCIAGMVIAVPMFALALMGHGLLLMIVWVFLFSSAYTARTQMMVESEDYAVPYGGPGPEGRVRTGRWPDKSAARAQAKRRREDEKIDAILAKVSAQGMHSLTWMEKRTLRNGSKRLR